MKHYVLGFLFDRVGQSVLLIQKTKPEWQKGRWNGIGGKVESDELPIHAMRREFQEETGLSITNWTHFCTFMGSEKCDPQAAKEDSEFAVHCFKCFSETLGSAKSTTDEHVMEHAVNGHNFGFLPNLKWLIPMALSHHLIFPYGGWYQIIDRAEDQSPANYCDTYAAFPKILPIGEILNPNTTEKYEQK